MAFDIPDGAHVAQRYFQASICIPPCSCPVVGMHADAESQA